MKALGINISRDQWKKTKGFTWLSDAPEPVLNPKDPEDSSKVLLAPLYAGVCGTDRSIWYRDAFEEMIFDSLKSQNESVRINGHEFVAQILKVGEAAAIRYGYKPGDIVSSESHIFCGVCTNCRHGQGNVCMNEKIIGISVDGCFAERLKMPAKVLWPVNQEKIRLEVAAIMEPFGNAVHACSKPDVRGKTIAIFGCGTIGMFAVLIAKALGARHVLALDPDSRHLEIAQALGADHVIQVDLSKSKTAPYINTALIKEVQTYFDGIGPDIAFEMAGPNDSVNHALLSTRRGGEIVLFGVKAGKFELPQFQDIIIQGKTIYGIIGRELFRTWQMSQGLLENKVNRVQDRLFEVILNSGKGSFIDFHQFNPKQFEENLKKFPKLVFNIQDKPL
jgi:threonine 3-dehydrogenase